MICFRESFTLWYLNFIRRVIALQWLVRGPSSKKAKPEARLFDQHGVRTGYGQKAEPKASTCTDVMFSAIQNIDVCRDGPFEHEMSEYSGWIYGPCCPWAKHKHVGHWTTTSPVLKSRDVKVTYASGAAAPHLAAAHRCFGPA